MHCHLHWNPEPDAADDRWLVTLLRDDAAHAPRLADDPFTAQVLQALPRPRRRWLDGLGATTVMVVLGLGLLSAVDVLLAPAAQLLDPLIGLLASALAQPSAAAMESLLVPLLALYLAGAALFED